MIPRDFRSRDDFGVRAVGIDASWQVAFIRLNTWFGDSVSWLSGSLVLNMVTWEEPHDFKRDSNNIDTLGQSGPYPKQ